jgi:hypothetical protein
MMLRQAIVALGPKTLVPVALVGSALISAGMLLVPHPHSGIYRFTLHAPVQASTIYVSAWNDGEVYVDHDGSDGKTLTFTRRADEHDGCRWQGTEILTPIGPHAYVYSYDEKIISCEEDAHPFVRTPRRGIVTVEQIEGNAGLTPFDDTQAPGDLWAEEEEQDGEELSAEIEEAVNEAADSADDDDCSCGCDADEADQDENDGDEVGGTIVAQEIGAKD